MMMLNNYRIVRSLLIATVINSGFHAKGDDTFSLSIVPYSYSEHDGRATLACPSVFYVVLTNISKQSVMIYEDSNDWGGYALTFEAKGMDGHIFHLEKRLVDRAWNNPITFRILPGHHYVFKVNFSPEIWRMLEKMKGDDAKMNFQIKAIFEEPSTRLKFLRNNPDVWKGRVESSPEFFHLNT